MKGNQILCALAIVAGSGMAIVGAEGWGWLILLAFFTYS